MLPPRSKETAKSDSYPHPSTPAASAVMRGNRKRDTTPELAVRKLLHKRGLRYRVNHRVTAGNIAVRPDIVFTRRRVAVFIDGCFWHGCPAHGTSPKVNTGYWAPKLERNKLRDIVVSEALTLNGWSVVRIWEHTDPLTAVDMILEAITQRT
jgi:DNA mismatch endonuclease (patch repair protein)